METELIDNNIYIQISKSNIDNALYNDDYIQACALLIMVLERLNNDEKVEFIDDYSTRLVKILRGISHLDDRSLDHGRLIHEDDVFFSSTCIKNKFLPMWCADMVRWSRNLNI